MFGLSTWEILIILVLALLFIGPDELPKVANKLGKGLRQVRGAMSKVDDEVRRTVRDFQAEAARLAEEDEENDKKRDPGAPIAPIATTAASADGTPAALPAPTKEALVVGGEAGAEAALPERAPRNLGTLAAKTSINARDWSKVGKTPVEGRVATVLPGRPPSESMAPPLPESAPIPAPPAPPTALADTQPPERS